MKTEPLIHSYPFLQGEGELATLTRAFDWSSTSLSTPDQWPQTLKTTISIVLNSHFPMVIWWGNDMIQFYNDAYRKSLGTEGKHPRALGSTAKECWPELWETIHEKATLVRETRKSIYLENRKIPFYRDGEVQDTYWTYSYNPLIGESGNVDGVLVVCNETTETVLNTAQLAESEKIYKGIVEQMVSNENRVNAIIESAQFPIGVYEGKDMRVTVANEVLLRTWGKGKDVIGKCYRDLLPELTGTGIFEQLENVYNTGIPFHARNKALKLIRDGVERSVYMNYSFMPLFDAQRNVYGVLSTAADITDLTLAKIKVEHSEENFRNIILQAPVAMCIMTGPTHVVEIANEKIIDLWGKPAEEVMFRPIFEGLPDAREQGLEELLHRVYTTGASFEALEMPVVLTRRGKQETVYQNFVYEPYRAPDGTILGVLAITIDVTEQVLARHKIEEVVVERTRELQQSNAELSQFAYITSHDLQEPARKISTFAEMLEKHLGAQLDDRSKLYLQKIATSSDRMLRLIRDVLAFSQLSKTNYRFEKVDLNSVFIEAQNDFELLMQQKQCVIESDVLPVIDAIPLQMSQLFGNLLSNALKFTKPDEALRLRVTVEKLDASAVDQNAGLRHSSEYYRINFSDNGIGFSQLHAEQIFNIFQRLHNRAEYDGTGIGLAMCRKIAENHGGQIHAESRPGQGAMFSVLLPANA